MATDIDRLNMAGPASPVNHSSSMHTANDVSMCSSSPGMHDDSCQLSTPTSKRQRLSPLEVPDFPIPDLRSAQPHRLSDSGHMNVGQIQPPHGAPQAQRFKDMHDKPPLSPNDPCFGMDLRKAALLRSLMLATDGCTSIAEHSKAHSAQKGKRKSRHLHKVKPSHDGDNASMETDCRSDRSSASPDTAASKSMATSLPYFSVPLQDHNSHNGSAGSDAPSTTMNMSRSFLH